MSALNLDAIRRLIKRYRLTENSLTAVILEKLLAEVEWLQAELNQREEVADDLTERLFMSGQEVKRLRSRIADLEDALWDAEQGQFDSLLKGVKVAEEIEELPPTVSTVAQPRLGLGASRMRALQSASTMRVRIEEERTMAIFITEQEMVDSIIDAAHDLGWLVYHQRSAWTEKGYRTALQGYAGFPDLVLANERHLMFVECKMPGQALTEQQKIWLNTLAWSGIDAFVVYPKDYDTLIERLAKGEE